MYTLRVCTSARAFDTERTGIVFQHRNEIDSHATGRPNMASAKKGDTVKVHYTGKLDDGSVFDSSRERDEPLEFKIGEGEVIPGFEEAVEGMSAGDEKTVTIPADQAHGDYNPQLVHEVDRGQIPESIPLEVGGQLQVQGQDGRAFVVTVAEVNDDSVKLDANHPLAGKDLTFELELVSAE